MELLSLAASARLSVSTQMCKALFVPGEQRLYRMKTREGSDDKDSSPPFALRLRLVGGRGKSRPSLGDLQMPEAVRIGGPDFCILYLYFFITVQSL